MAMGTKAGLFCGYFNTCRVNLSGMEAFLDKNHENFSDEDKKAIAQQMRSKDIRLPDEDDAVERWNSMVIAMGGTSTRKVPEPKVQESIEDSSQEIIRKTHENPGAVASNLGLT